MKTLHDWMEAQLAERKTEPNSGLGKAILHRRNSLFYKTLNGARVGDLFISLIHTCELNGANSLDYPTEL